MSQDQNVVDGEIAIKDIRSVVVSPRVDEPIAEAGSGVCSQENGVVNRENERRDLLHASCDGVAPPSSQNLTEPEGEGLPQPRVDDMESPPNNLKSPVDGTAISVTGTMHCHWLY